MTLNKPNAPFNSSQSCTTDSQPSLFDFCEEYAIPTKRKRVSLDTMKYIVDMADKGSSLKSIRAKYKWYRSENLATFRRCVRFGGSNADKMHRVNEAVKAQVRQARDNGETVHDQTITQWGQRAAREVGAEDFFRASHTWLRRFKEKEGIVVRDITGEFGRHEPTAQLTKAQKIEAFRQQYSQLEWYFPRRLIWNYDQTGFNYEITDKRTLSWKGERDTRVKVGSKSKTTHSYTSQPMINRDGKTIGKLLLCLREPGGEFPGTKLEEIKALERRYRNIHVVASKSGKMSKVLMEEWVKEVLIPARRRALTADDGTTLSNDDTHIDDTTLDDQVASANYTTDNEDNQCFEAVSNSIYCWDPPFVSSCARSTTRAANEQCMVKPEVLLLADSWTGQTSDTFRDRLRGQRVKLLQIPPATTAELQPLDVNFNRQYKKFVKAITRRAISDGLLDQVTNRAGIMNIHSLIWNQFSSVQYQDLIRHAWHNTDPDYSVSELATRPPGRNVDAVQFRSFNGADKCEHHTNCSNHAFIKCAHCGKLLCLKHFLERTCFHDDPITMDMSADDSQSSHDSSGHSELKRL